MHRPILLAACGHHTDNPKESSFEMLLGSRALRPVVADVIGDPLRSLRRFLLSSDLRERIAKLRFV
jgi:hypothetical protein